MGTDDTRTTQQTISRSAAIVLASATFAAGLFAGIILQSELGGPAPQPPRQAMTAPQPAPSNQPGAQPSAMDARIAQFEAKAKASPDNAQAWTSLGNVYFDANRPAEAIDAYQRSLKLNPGNPNVLTDMGVMFRRLGDPNQALASFDEAIAADPNHRIARLNKGVVLLHDLGKHEEALATWRELLAIDPTATTPDGRPLAQVVEELTQRFKK
jgi:cytochrome c-type biogenesis protein CcmH/NrfG